MQIKSSQNGSTYYRSRYTYKQRNKKKSANKRINSKSLSSVLRHTLYSNKSKQPDKGVCTRFEVTQISSNLYSI